MSFYVSLAIAFTEIGSKKSKYIAINASVNKNQANVKGKNNFHPTPIS